MSGTDYFSYTNLVANTLARASDVNARMAAIQGGFAMLPDPTKLQQGRATYVEDTDGANALVVALDFAPASYIAGLELTIKVNSPNTGPATINVNGLGAKTILRADGSPLSSGDLASGQIIKVVYDGTNFRLIAPAEAVVASYAAAAATSAATATTKATSATSSASAAATSATNAANSASAAATSATNAANSATAAATAVSGYAALAGANFTGAVTVQTPTAPTNPATKAYVDAAVFSAGSVTADESTIHSASGVFGLKSIAAATVLGSVAGGVPAALTGTQLATIVDAATTSLKGLMSAADKTKLDAITGTNTGDQTNIAGNAATASSLATSRTIAISGAVTGTATGFNGTANITIPITALDVGAATTGTLAVARGGTGTTTSTGSGANVLATAPTLSNPVVGTQSAGDSSTKAASTAFVQNALGGFASAFLGVQSTSASKTLADSDNNDIIFCTGSTGRTITAGSTPTAGFSCILAFISTVAWTFSCAGGVYTDGATATVASVSIPAGSRCTAIHKGAGVWLLSGV